MPMTVQMLGAGLFAGLALLGLGTAIGNQRSTQDAGLSPFAMLLKAAGLAVLTLTLYRYGRSHW